MITNAIEYCLDPKISKEISEQLSNSSIRQMFFTYLDLGLLFMRAEVFRVGGGDHIVPGSVAVLLLLRIGSGVPDVFQLGELLVDLTEGNL